MAQPVRRAPSMFKSHPHQILMTANLAGLSLRVPELREYSGQFESIKADVADLTAGLDKAQFNWRPSTGRWSVAECIVHLNATAELIIPPLSRKIERARERKMFSEGPFRRTLFSQFFLSFVEPPYRMKIPGPRNLLPAQEAQPLYIVQEFIALQDRIITAMSEAQGLDLGGMKMNSPFNRPVRLTLAEWFLFLAVHERRHLWQARNVRNDPGFPAPGR
jgi:hypothetical protein